MDREDAIEWFAILGFVVVMILIPPLIGYGLWILLSPIGFWQTLAMLVIEIFFIGFLYIVEMVLMSIASVFV